MNEPRKGHRRFIVDLPAPLADKLEERAKAQGSHPTSFIRAALATYWAIQDGDLKAEWEGK